MLSFVLNGYACTTQPGGAGQAQVPQSPEVEYETTKRAFHRAVGEAVLAHRNFDQRVWLREVLATGEAGS
jgi:hypothetical protein